MVKNYLRIRIREIISSKEFQAIFLIITMLMSLDLFLMLTGNINSYQSQTTGYYNLFFSSSNNPIIISGYYFHLFIYILAVASTSIIFVNDKNHGLKNKFILSLGRNKYYINNLIVVFITTFILIFTPQFLNFLLSLLTYNINKFINLGIGAFYSPISYYNFPLLSVYKKSPLLLNFLYTIIPAFVMGIWAMFIYSISLFIKDSKVYNIPIISLIISLISQAILEFTGNSQYRLSSFLYPISDHKTPIKFSFFIVLLIILTIISLIGSFIKANYFKDEI